MELEKAKQHQRELETAQMEADSRFELLKRVLSNEQLCDYRLGDGFVRDFSDLVTGQKSIASSVTKISGRFYDNVRNVGSTVTSFLSSVLL